MGEAKAVLHRRTKRLNTKIETLPEALARSNGESSLATPDFRFVEYPYQPPGWTGPHLPQIFSQNPIIGAALDPHLLTALRRMR